MHTLLTGWPKTDHRNGNGLDNQMLNLRPATDAENSRNRGPRPGSTSCYKGVNWYKRSGKWQAGVRYGGVTRHLGYFADETEAARAYDSAARVAFGEFAWLNFPEVA
jgi:hypothetical protein